MNNTTIRFFYWTSFALSVIIIPLNFGLGLIVMGIVILPALILHLTIGLSLNRIKNHNTLIIVSAVNLLTFALIRPDGVHALTDNGLSSLLGIFGIYAGYNYEYENYFSIASLILLILQVIVDLILLKIKKANE